MGHTQPVRILSNETWGLAGFTGCWNNGVHSADNFGCIRDIIEEWNDVQLEWNGY
jgi:hypothetical protein